MFGGVLLFVWLLIWIGAATIAWHVAKAKGLSASDWAIAAFFFGPLALVGVAGMPDRRLRSYMRAVAIKLDAVEEREATAVEIEDIKNIAPKTGTDDLIYIDSMLRSDEERIASAIEQLNEEERASANAETSELKIGRMGWVKAKDGKYITRLFYVDFDNGKHIYRRG